MQEERDDIEKFFAKRLGEKDFPFEEEQWEILAKRLDDAGPVKTPFWIKFRKRFGYILLPIITFLIGWYLQRGTEQASPQGIQPAATPTEEPQNSAQPAIEELNDNREEPAQTLEKPVERQRQVSTDQAFSTTKSEEVAQREILRESVLEEEKIRASRSGVPPIGLSNLVYYNIAPMNMPDLNFPLPVLDLSLDVAIGDSVFTEEEKLSPEWSITVLAAPDFNSTNFRDLYNSIGESVGFQLNRKTRDKFQVSFGLLLNNKVYSAGKGEYSPKQGYWTRGVVPDITDAKCLVLEIPVSVGMRLFRTNRGALWVGQCRTVFLCVPKREIRLLLHQ